MAREGDGLTLSAEAPKIPAAAAVVMLALSWPFAIGFEQGRRKQRELVEDLRGAPPEQITRRADPSGLHLRRERAGTLREEASCPRARILGLAVLALPSYGERVRPMDARLYARGAPDFALALPGPGAEVVRKLLVRGILGELC